MTLEVAISVSAYVSVTRHQGKSGSLYSLAIYELDSSISSQSFSQKIVGRTEWSNGALVMQLVVIVFWEYGQRQGKIPVKKMKKLIFAVPSTKIVLLESIS